MLHWELVIPFPQEVVSTHGCEGRYLGTAVITQKMKSIMS